MPDLKQQDPEFEDRIRESFAQQGLMGTFEAELATVEPGVVEIEVPFADALTQQDGFLHAGVVLACTDSACGYASLSLMPSDARVLTVELKVNLLAPAGGERLRTRGEVVKPGSSLFVCRGDAYSLDGDESKHVATLLATMIVAPDRGSSSG